MTNRNRNNNPFNVRLSRFCRVAQARRGARGELANYKPFRTIKKKTSWKNPRGIPQKQLRRTIFCAFSCCRSRLMR